MTERIEKALHFLILQIVNLLMITDKNIMSLLEHAVNAESKVWKNKDPFELFRQAKRIIERLTTNNSDGK